MEAVWDEGMRWKLCGNKLEVVDAFKYLGVWFNRLWGNVQLAKMTEKAEEWVGRVEWMSGVNRQVEKDVRADG